MKGVDYTGLYKEAIARFKDGMCKAALENTPKQLPYLNVEEWMSRNNFDLEGPFIKLHSDPVRPLQILAGRGSLFRPQSYVMVFIRPDVVNGDRTVWLVWFKKSFFLCSCVDMVIKDVVKIDLSGAPEGVISKPEVRDYISKEIRRQFGRKYINFLQKGKI